MIKKIGIIFILAFTGIAAFVSYNYFLTGNINENIKGYELYVYQNSSLDDIINDLNSKKAFINDNSFRILAENSKSTLKPGHYIIKPGMTNRDILRTLSAGLQTPVKVRFNNARTNQDFAKIIAKQLIFSDEELLVYLNNSDSLSDYSFDHITIKSMFIPNTYEFYWTSSPKKFMDKMYTEYKRFWNESRKQKAANIGLSQVEVSILASIVQAEQNINISEQPTIAGLYMNRIKKRIPLQADPTVLYAMQDFTRKRLLKADLKIDSPFNTYKYAGLPPGPINLPASNALDAVLNYKNHSYLYMCAKADFSGFHSFSSTYRQHIIYAKLYQKALTKKGIKR